MSEKITLHHNFETNSTPVIETESEHQLVNGFLRVEDTDDNGVVRINYFDLADVGRIEVERYPK